MKNNNTNNPTPCSINHFFANALLISFAYGVALTIFIGLKWELSFLIEIVVTISTTLLMTIVSAMLLPYRSQTFEEKLKTLPPNDSKIGLVKGYFGILLLTISMFIIYKYPNQSDHLSLLLMVSGALIYEHHHLFHGKTSKDKYYYFQLIVTIAISGVVIALGSTHEVLNNSQFVDLYITYQLYMLMIGFLASSWCKHVTILLKS